MNNLVVIIAYAPSPSPFERASFGQCLRVLGRHDIRVVCPQSLDVTEYERICAEYSVPVRYECFDDRWFTSVASYNRLLLSPVFYERFLDADHMLLYQLDAWVFEDQFEQWCTAGYDYIGAPWFTDRGELLPFAGNGGFCLRKVRACYDLLMMKRRASWNYSFFFASIPARSSLRALAKKALHCMEMAVCRINPAFYFAHYRGHEDFAFVKAMSAIEGYRVAPPEVAMCFAFERFPEMLLQRTEGKLPFGAHALARHAPGFWSGRLPGGLLSGENPA